jgi:two-component system LytT family response regulator
MSIDLKYIVIEDSLKVCEGIKERMQEFSNWTSCEFAHHVANAKLIVAKEKPQLIFIDWALKGGSAYEVLAHIQEISNYNPYIIFNTGYQSENPEIPQEIINNYKVDKYLIKPLWENLRKNISYYLQEAEEKLKLNASIKQSWLTDISKKRSHVDFNKLICVCQQFENHYNKDFYFQDFPSIVVRLSWQNISELLIRHKVDFFITNCRQHLIVKDHIDSYQRPFVKLKKFSRKIEVVKERLHEFEAWL